jgi:hypothetical protein
VGAPVFDLDCVEDPGEDCLTMHSECQKVVALDFDLNCTERVPEGILAAVEVGPAPSTYLYLRYVASM